MQVSLAAAPALSAASAANESVPAQDFARALGIYRGTPDRPPDPAAAAPVFRQAAEAGSAEAASYLSLLYARGYGVPRDPEAALMWLDQALAILPPGAERSLSLANRGVIWRSLSPAQRRRVPAQPPEPALPHVAAADADTVVAPAPSVKGDSSKVSIVPPGSPSATAADRIAPGSRDRSSKQSSNWRPLAAAPEADIVQVQLGAFADEASANRRLMEVRRELNDLMREGGLTVLLGKDKRYRVRAGPMTAAAADRTCAALRARKVDCLIVTR